MPSATITGQDGQPSEVRLTREQTPEEIAEGERWHAICEEAREQEKWRRRWRRRELLMWPVEIVVALAPLWQWLAYIGLVLGLGWLIGEGYLRPAKPWPTWATVGTLIGLVVAFLAHLYRRK